MDLRRWLSFLLLIAFCGGLFLFPASSYAATFVDSESKEVVEEDPGSDRVLLNPEDWAFATVLRRANHAAGVGTTRDLSNDRSPFPEESLADSPRGPPAVENALPG